jgi:site-specific DNA-adenine methylase
VTYPGGKGGAGVYQAIINQMPPHDVYIEPFLGAGAVMRRKRPASVNLGIDIDPAVIAGFGEAGDRPSTIAAYGAGAASAAPRGR